MRSVRTLLRFNLKSLMFLVSFVAIAIGVYVHRVRRQQNAIQQVRAMGGMVYYGGSWVDQIGMLPTARRFLRSGGVDYLLCAIEIRRPDEARAQNNKEKNRWAELSDGDVAMFLQLPYLRQIDLSGTSVTSDGAEWLHERMPDCYILGVPY